MASILTSGKEGISFTTAYVYNEAAAPEYPGTPFVPGDHVFGTEGTQWLFCKVAASQTIAAGDFVYVSSTDNGFVVTALANAAKAKLGARVGIAGAAATTGTTSYTYIWVCVSGFYADANVATGASANTVLHTTATAGRLSATTTAGTTGTVNGVVALATAASNKANVFLTGPVIGAAD